MASSTEGTGAEDGREEMQGQNSSLNWMLDSSHVNVGLWNYYFDGRPFWVEEPGVQDLEELPQQSLAPDSSFPVFHVNFDPVREFDGRRASRAAEQGLGGRRRRRRLRLDANRVDAPGIGLGLSATLNDPGQDGHYQNTSTGSIQGDPSSWTSGSTAWNPNSMYTYEQSPELSRSIFNESSYSHVGRQAPGVEYDDFCYGYPELSDRISQTQPSGVPELLNHSPFIAGFERMPEILHFGSPIATHCGRLDDSGCHYFSSIGDVSQTPNQDLNNNDQWFSLGLPTESPPMSHFNHSPLVVNISSPPHQAWGSTSEVITDGDEYISAEHQVSQLVVPEIRVQDASQSTAEFESSKDVLGPWRSVRWKDLSPVASPLSSNSEHNELCAEQEAGRLTTDSQAQKSFDDQLLAPYPKRKTASSHGSFDSGYISDSMDHSKNPKGADNSHWLKLVDTGDVGVKIEPTDVDIDVIALCPNDEPYHHREVEIKNEPFETFEEKADTKGLQESECKSERKGESPYIKDEPEVVRRDTKRRRSANKDPAYAQPSSKPYDLKQRREFAIEKELAKSKTYKTHPTKGGVSDMKAEPMSVVASSATTALQQPCTSFNVEPRHSKHHSTLPLPFGHPKSRQWTEMLPSIKACTKKIMGRGNGGALELFAIKGEPTICITCSDPRKLDLALLRSCMEPLGLRFNITQGKICKSAGEHDGLGSAVYPDQSQCMVPAVHGHYMQRPTCGASLGTADGPLKDGKVSLGGYLKVKHLDRRDWSYYAMTVHHILVSDDQNELPSSITCNNEDEEMAEPGYDNSPGVRNGVYDVGDGPGGRVAFSCPAVPDTQSLVSRLEDRRIMHCANEDYAAIDNLDNLDDLLNKLCTSGNTMFGNAAWSSGLCLDQDVEMDWLLIGDLPMDRIGFNDPGDVTGYMEGNHRDPISKVCWTPSAYVDEPTFSILMNPSARWWEQASSAGGYLSRVFGRGSETGLADGFLSPHPSIFYDETYGPYDAWAFTPRYTYGLGDSGDSGTWIFTSEGKLLGQIISYNRARHITYFTPICKIFNHIKRITGATDVELLTPEDVTQILGVAPRSAGGLLSPEQEPSYPSNCSISTATNIQASLEPSTAPKRFVTPPRTTAYSSQPLPFPSYHVRCSTAGLPTPGSTHASDTSD